MGRKRFGAGLQDVGRKPAWTLKRLNRLEALRAVREYRLERHAAHPGAIGIDAVRLAGVSASIFGTGL